MFSSSVVYLLWFLATPGVVSSSFRGTFVPPQTTPSLVEGDIAVPAAHAGTGLALGAFLTRPSALWPRGFVPYRIESFEWNGEVEPIFLDEQIENITQSLTKIMLFNLNILCTGRWQKTSKIPTSSSQRWVGLNVSPVDVGRVGKKGQRVNLGSPECLNIGTILHETLHGLGLSALSQHHSNPLKVLCMSTPDQTAISMFPFFWTMLSLAASKTSKKCPMTLTVAEGHPLIPSVTPSKIQKVSSHEKCEENTIKTSSTLNNAF